MKPIHAKTSAAAILLTAVLLSLPGCTQVGDRLTGVRLESHRPNECVKACNQEFVADLTAETKKLTQALEACRQSTDAERKACHQAALAVFHAAVTALGQERKGCVNDCHQQGSGQGG
ncbi:MAG TPA: hypothetical protein VFB89_12310 [Gemmatimonadales bacterium]|nr:hypothetical protein [Gemmatimonadales bacterium]